MVIRPILLVVTGLVISSAGVRADAGKYDIVVLRSVGLDDTRVLPGEPLTIVLEVELAVSEFGDRTAARIRTDIGRRISQAVVLNGRTFANRLSEGTLNDIAFFEVGQFVEQNAKNSNGALLTVPILVKMFFNVATETVLFDHWGLYSFRFGFPDGPQVDVAINVEPLLPGEDAVFEKLAGHDVLAECLTGSTKLEKCLAPFAPQLQELRALARGTRYKRFGAALSFLASMGSEFERRLRDVDGRFRTSVPTRDEYEKRLLELQPGFQESNNDVPKNDVELAALLSSAELSLLRAKRELEPSVRKRHLDIFDDALKQVESSPVAVGPWQATARTLRIEATKLSRRLRPDQTP